MIPEEVKSLIKKLVTETTNEIISDLKTEIKDLQETTHLLKTEILIQKEGDNI